MTTPTYKRRTWRRLGIAMAAVAAMAAATTSLPEAAHAQDGDVVVLVRAIAAVPDGHGVDNQLSDIQPRLVRAFTEYGAFKELARHRVNMSRVKSYDFPLAAENHMVVTLLGEESGLVQLGLNVNEKFNTEVRVSRGGTLFQAGLPHGDGMLIIALTILKE